MPDTRVDLTLLYLINYSARQPILQFVALLEPPPPPSSLFLSASFLSSFSVAASAPLAITAESRLLILARVLSQPLDRSSYSSDSFRSCVQCTRHECGRNMRVQILTFSLNLNYAHAAKYAPPLYSHIMWFVILPFSIILKVSVNKCAYYRVCRFRGFHISMQRSLL